MKTKNYRSPSSLPRRAVERVRDEAASVPGKPYRRERGFTLLELLVTVSLIAIVTGIALPQFPRNAYSLWTAQQQLLADLRSTRADALTKGDHFRFDISTATTYAEYRMRLVGGVWVVNGPPVRTRTLPPGVTFTSGVGSQFEFNTRGLMLNPGAATQIGMVDGTSHTRVVTVWPSGQVMPL